MKRALFALVRKDLKLFRADRRAVIISFAMPAMLALLFGFVFRGHKGEVHVSTRVVDLDGSAGSKRIAGALGENPILGATPATRDEASDLLRRGKIDVAVVIPKGFVAGAVAGAHPAIEILADPTSNTEAGIASGVVDHVASGALGPDLGPDFVHCATIGNPYTTQIKPVSEGDVSYDGASHALAGMGVQFILIGAVDSAVGMLTERQRGLFRRLRTAPLARAVLIASRLLSGAIIALVVVAFLYAFGSMTMGISIKGSQAGFALVAVTFALMASALGMLMASIGKTPQATRGIGIFVILIATMLSGAWFPSFLFPPWMQKATLFVPTRWAVDGLDAMTWRGLPLHDALAPAGVLLLSATIMAVWAALRFRWDE